MDKHLSDREIDALVQNEAGSEEYFQISSAYKATLFSHVECCDICKLKMKKSEHIFWDLRDSEIRNSRNMNMFKLLSAAAAILVLITFLPFNSTQIGTVNYRDFGIFIERSASNVSKNNQLKYDIIEGNYDNVLQYFEAKNLTKEDSLLVSASLFLKGQKGDDEKLMQKALNFITDKKLKSKIMEKK